MNLTNAFRELLYKLQNPINFNYEPPGSFEAAKMILWAVENNHHITADSDKDPDGYFAGRQLCDILDYLNHKKYTVVSTLEKRHGIDGATMLTIANNNSKLLIVLDSSSDKIDELRKLSERMKVIVIDHHQPMYNSVKNTENFVFINSHHFKDTGYKSMSAGLVTYLTFRPLMNSLSKVLCKESASLAYASLITDSIAADSHEVISFMESIRKSNVMHPILYTFTSEFYRNLSREFISYSVSPKLNACFRSNNIKYVYDLFFRENYRLYLSGYNSLAEISKVYHDTKELRKKLISIAQPHISGKFITVDLSPVARALNLNSYSVKQYTGLVANEFSKRTYKPCVCYIKGSKTIKGSVRDYFGRPLLNYFSNYISAGGHPPAFGFEDNYLNFENLMSNLPSLSEKLPESKNEDLKIVLSKSHLKNLDSFKEAIEMYSSFNELGTYVPNIYIDLSVPTDCRITNQESISKTSIGNIEIKSFSGYLFPNVRYTFKPMSRALIR